MEDLFAIVTFLMIMFNLPFMTSALLGIKFNVENPNNAYEVKAVKRNHFLLKFYAIFNAIVSIFLLIFSIIKFG